MSGTQLEPQACASRSSIPARAFPRNTYTTYSRRSTPQKSKRALASDCGSARASSASIADASPFAAGCCHRAAHAFLSSFRKAPRLTQRTRRKPLRLPACWNANQPEAKTTKGARCDQAPFVVAERLLLLRESSADVVQLLLSQLF